MKLKNVLLASTAAAALAAIAVPAYADNIVTNQWYGATFVSSVGSPLSGFQFAPGTNGPILVGTGTSIAAPTVPWTITLPNGGFLTIVNSEISGDAFTLSDNSSTLGTTSSPISGDGTCNTDIGCALGNSNYSSATFALPDGSNSISGILSTYSDAGGGDVYFVIQANAGTDVPEPATLALLGLGTAGLAAVRRRKR